MLLCNYIKQNIQSFANVICACMCTTTIDSEPKIKKESII